MNSSCVFARNALIIAAIATFVSSCAPKLTTGNSSAGGSGGAGGAGGAGGGCSALLTNCDGECVDPSTDTRHCGACGSICPAETICAGGECKTPSCAPNSTQNCYSGPTGTQNAGICTGGKQTCTADGTSWGPCIGEVLPAKEICFNGLDDDCNGRDGDSSCLVNTDLLVRYFLDEAESGSQLTALDSAPAPLHLPISLGPGNGQPEYTSLPTGRGLFWKTPDSAGVAKTPIDNSKIIVALEGKQQLTIELVAQVNSATSYNRLWEIASATNIRAGVYTLSTPSRFAARVNGADVAAWNTDFASLGRVILHVVIDSTAPTPSDRVRLYLNGALQSASGGTPPAQNENIALGPSKWISLGNNEGETRALSGALYYAALYAGAMSEAEITSNVAVLQVWDDK